MQHQNSVSRFILATLCSLQDRDGGLCVYATLYTHYDTVAKGETFVVSI
ncbi:hypothetical protein GBAR_LOCUS23170 [Geodia barretti]|uniref:Uncharacterized protein n=1 Tax=Geodia barretti TaxID=519541 RepID=A0AA35T5R1_GEOBA|nr:hypothetical protein GBAR_LOCUS23170 [Geodia barretti]